MAAPFATLPEASRGRLYPEEAAAHRSPFQRDRDRIIHSSAFRRLKHKTQVFVEHEGDYYRTRLTHSVEVAQVARTIARVLGLNEELAEAVALAHDLGHPPFGHTGEDALQGADGALRRVRPQRAGDQDRDPARGALCRVRRAEPDLGDAGGDRQAQRAGVAGRRRGAVRAGEYDAVHDLELGTHASAEAQVAAISDDIAYNNHDLADGLRAGLFTLEDLRGLPLIGAVHRGGGRALAGAGAGAAGARGAAAVLRAPGRGRAGDEPGAGWRRRRRGARRRCAGSGSR